MAIVHAPDTPRKLSMLNGLDRVLSPSNFPFASNDYLFRDAYFGRDSLEVAEDLLRVRPKVARATIHTLAALQGRFFNRSSEEELGKIHHEYRAVIMDGREICPESRQILRNLARHWEMAATEEESDGVTELTYFGTVDATPLYVRLVSRYCRAFGREFLEEPYSPLHSEDGGSSQRLIDSVRLATEWVAQKVEHSDLHLLEFCGMSAHSHPFQAWKDGAVSYMHPSGELANYLQPIASIEVQGLAYDALTLAASLLEEEPTDVRTRWQSLAASIQKAVVNHFWMPDENYFAMGVDRDPSNGTARQVRLISSNPGALLDSTIFDTLDVTLRRKYVGSVVQRIHSEEFLTPAGIRVTSLDHVDIPGYPAYQSTYTVWHKETYDVAKGLRRQGFPRLATDLETRLVNAINVTGGATEFLYVMPDNHVNYNPWEKRRNGSAVEIAGTNVPENDQAWSISAALAAKWRRGHPGDTSSPNDRWQSSLEDEKLSQFPHTRPLRTMADITRARAYVRPMWINMGAGREREEAFLAAHRLPSPEGPSPITC